MILPRLIRFRDAPAYLGMDRNRFNAEVRPHITEVPMGVQGVAFDRLDLDAWVDEYVRRNGRAPATKGDNSWGTNESPASEKPVECGTSRSRSRAMASFEKALEKRASKKPNGI
jgi:hypothetical protein